MKYIWNGDFKKNFRKIKYLISSIPYNKTHIIVINRNNKKYENKLIQNHSINEIMTKNRKIKMQYVK